MIRINRNSKDPDLLCFRPRKQKGLKRFDYRYKNEVISDAEYEAKIACDHFGDKKNYEIASDGHRRLTKAARKFKFWIYNRKEIRAELERVFRHKCAYCEYEIGIRTDFDIEHFRPKKAVEHSETRAMKEPGYYWLAAVWQNLMPSCQYCNQARTQKIVGIEGTQTLGKKNQFPLSNEKRRITSPKKDVAVEEAHRLLLDPCSDHPENHIYFVTHESTNEMGFVKPRIRQGKPDLKGTTSITVFALNAKTLVDKRHEHASKLILLLNRLSDSAKHYHNASKTESEFEEVFWNQLQKAMLELHDLLKPNAMFLGLVRQVVKDFDKRGAFKTLKLHGIDPKIMVVKSIEASEQAVD